MPNFKSFRPFLATKWLHLVCNVMSVSMSMSMYRADLLCGSENWRWGGGLRTPAQVAAPLPAARSSCSECSGEGRAVRRVPDVWTLSADVLVTADRSGMVWRRLPSRTPLPPQGQTARARWLPADAATDAVFSRPAAARRRHDTQRRV